MFVVAHCRRYGSSHCCLPCWYCVDVVCVAKLDILIHVHVCWPQCPRQHVVCCCCCLVVVRCVSVVWRLLQWWSQFVLSNCCRLPVVGFVVVAGAVVAPTAVAFALTCMCCCRCWIVVIAAVVFAVAAFASGVVRNP